MTKKNGRISVRQSFAVANRQEDLVKEMFEKTGYFSVYYYGFDRVLPEFAGRGNHKGKKDGIIGCKQVRAMPDLFIIDEKRKKGMLVEVKVYPTFPPKKVVMEARHYDRNHWPNAYLLIVSKDGMRMELVKNILKRNGEKIAKLNPLWVSAELQRDYLGKILACSISES